MHKRNIVRSSNKRAKELLNNIIREFLSAGGFIDHNVAVQEKNGNLSLLWKGREQHPQPAIQLPLDAMPAIGDFQFTFDGQSAQISGVKGQPNSSAVRLLELMLALYNHLNKFQQFLTASPISAFQQYEELVQLLNRGANTKLQIPEDNPFGYKLQLFFVSRRYQDLQDNRLKLLPFVDLIDHHAFAEPFKPVVTVPKPYLEVTYRPVKGEEGKLLASYGAMDALDTLVSYGFVDASAFFIRSVAFIFEASGVEFHVGRGDVTTGQLPEAEGRFQNPNSRFYASKSKTIEKGLAIEFILIPNKDHISANDDIYRRYFTQAEEHLGMSPGELNNNENLTSFKKKLLAENRAYYSKLALISKKYLSNGDVSIAAKMMVSLLKHQNRIMRNYEKHAL